MMDGGGAFGELSLSHAKQQNFKREQRSSQSNANNLSFPYSLPTPTNMLGSVLLAVFLPCIGMSAALIVYMCLLYYFTDHFSDPALPAKPASDSGLSPSQLDKLPRITGKELVMGNECAVCLDHIGTEQPARLVPGCNHAFHLECADTWLSEHPLCPLCRAKLDPALFSSSQNPC
ncbi:hypothetical protein AAZX31_17G246900 [Glycine max]|nr:E3 ubiquitin-protein ligase ATL23 [Glycine max]KAG4379473.1 hypothetical protein GLYMA_17G260700v4 [Glycine max]KAG4931811.1 hypothetical protein JHK86_048772 [Glycine max]KAG4944771.1 hypothetical protein JHK85_049417 [Glycine max]KAG5103834.1 hypothetical protein JHK84_048803 [Glycine max]KAH1120206.1 hypothetical protein GYH30_048523 [Glycine max]|eukprot:XP_003550438.2 E3 ubiquitin-protein ligase ATL23 [Glycine max]